MLNSSAFLLLRDPTERAGWLLVKWPARSGNGGSTITPCDARQIETDATDQADSQWTETEDIWTTGGDLRCRLDGLTAERRDDGING